jgi:glyceraldehyde 3-phosphate dehydrogenase
MPSGRREPARRHSLTMPATSIGLVGCGRIGRSLVRLLARHESLRLALVEEPAEPEAVEYLLRFDTLLGRFPGELSRSAGQLLIEGREVALVAPEEGGTPRWGELGIELVVEASGRERSRAELERHLEAGAERVVLCSPPGEPPDFTYVAGVNADRLGAEHRIVSVGSVTANAIGPVLRVLAHELGVERAFVSTVHAYTSQLRLADVPSPDMRSGRAAAENIIPQPTNVDEVLAELLPELAGRISGLALHVPVPNGSVVDLTCWHPRAVAVDEVNAALHAACGGELAGIVDYEDQPIVSSDILMTRYSGVFDSLSTQVVAGRVSKTLTFYDNGWGYANRVVDLLVRLAAMESGASR